MTGLYKIYNLNKNTINQRGKMEDQKQPDRAVYVSADVHHEIKMMAARKKVSIKQALKEMVEWEKKGPSMLQKKEICGFFGCNEKSAYLDGNGKIAICAGCYDLIKNQSKKDRFLKMD
ncbi:MAG TPA: hypothetical protein ENH91_16250 [Leeuwenhoekiella sp.]|nr:hypothetical protein [Leeuwenhoekiella sp.]